MARSQRKSDLGRRRKRAKTLELLKSRYAAARRDDRVRIVEKLRRVAPWLTEEYLRPRGG
jgi:hypothetical protein